MKSQFEKLLDILNIYSPEIKTPLNGLVGFLAHRHNLWVLYGKLRSRPPSLK